MKRKRDTRKGVKRNWPLAPAGERSAKRARIDPESGNQICSPEENKQSNINIVHSTNKGGRDLVKRRIVYQNCCKGEANMAALYNEAITSEASLIFCTEPAIKGSTQEAKGMPYAKRLHVRHGKTRALIAVLDKALHVTFCPALSTPDCAVALWNTDGGIICVALYCGHDQPTDKYIQQLQRIAEYADEHQYRVLVNGDFNAETPQRKRAHPSTKPKKRGRI